MNKEKTEILIFAGTTEGRKLSECLAAAGVRHTVCVATEYGRIVLEPHSLAEVHQGRMNRKQIANFLQCRRLTAVVDATHPYAKEVTCNIKAAVKELEGQGMFIPYLRLKRDSLAADRPKHSDYITYFTTNEECARALEHTEGNILLAAGSKELSKYCAIESVKNRLYVRVLPSMESLSLCMEHGICGRQIIAMQGPFTMEMNEAIIRQYHISCLVTKESGVSGGYGEKLEAAGRTGTQVFVVGRPEEEEGYSFTEICVELEKLCGKKLRKQGRIEIVLAGIGMGHINSMTEEVRKAVEEADILFGAERLFRRTMLDLSGHEGIYFYFRAEEIIPYLRKVQEKNLFMENKRVVVLFSGDSGFYSGCHALYEALNQEIYEERLQAAVKIMPGISSVAYLASCIGESYQDAAVYSMHGKEVCNLLHRIRSSPKTFLLMSGVRDVNRLGRLLIEAGMTQCSIVTGYQLSYEDQQITSHTPEECCALSREGLYTCFIKNHRVIDRQLTHGIADMGFIRDKVPMTKEEVREVSICKLRLHDKAVVYDIGSGTGSVAVEIASLSDDIQVYAIERNKEAVSLIKRNQDKFGLQNITVVEGMAPEELSELPVATHAFVGGSGGRLKEILEILRQINSKMRVVINAVTMETVCEIKEFLSLYDLKEEEIVQIQANRVKKAGNYHLVQAENPVWICSFTFACGRNVEK
ncbi:MAG: precorrin-6A reductase [Lachnospiraceae bacterium]|nr:precorrin-6A reductase [Lachnospiraceae bacterium]